jgi:hypothetical protein
MNKLTMAAGHKQPVGILVEAAVANLGEAGRERVARVGLLLGGIVLRAVLQGGRSRTDRGDNWKNDGVGIGRGPNAARAGVLSD